VFGSKRVVPQSDKQLGNWCWTGGRPKRTTLMNSDFKELLQAFANHKVRYLVVGGYAVMHYSQPRFTKDLDLWLEPTPENAKRVMEAFAEFGMPLIDVTQADFAQESLQYMVGRAPVLFDFLTSLPQQHFAECWECHVTDLSEGFPIHYLAKESLLKAKKIAGRLQDLADIDEMERADRL
jgi:hypothetical protein